jgi:hypothetical protein
MEFSRADVLPAWRGSEIMFNRVENNNKSRGESLSSVTIVKQDRVGRERLVHLDGEVQKAETAVSELEQRIERLDAILVEADVAHRALQAAIAADDGIALARYSAGNAAVNSEIAKLVMASDNTARAATAAKAALPTAHAALDNAKEQVVSLRHQRAMEMNRVLALLADVDARKYADTFDLLGRLHDRLVGYASIAEGNQGDIWRIQDPLKTVRFATPSMGDQNADPFLRHQMSDLTVGESARKWSAIRDRLQFDANADLTDLMV